MKQIPVCKTDGIKKCKAGSISLRLFKLKQIEVNNGQKTIDIRPRTRYNISNLIRKQCYHYGYAVVGMVAIYMNPLERNG